MKRNPLGMLALLLAIAIVTFSSYTKQQFKISPNAAPSKYITYEEGPQNELDSYTNLGTAPTMQPNPCPSAATLCWIRVDDVNNDNVIDASDFTASFNALDTNSDGDLDDQSEVAGRLEKKP